MALGYCGTHYRRVLRHGDPSVVRTSPRGALSPFWKRDGQVSYPTAHKRVYVARGRADAHSCVDCGQQAREWSYDRTDPDELTATVLNGSGAPVAVQYSSDPGRYSPRCKSCHNVFDYAGHS